MTICVSHYFEWLTFVSLGLGVSGRFKATPSNVMAVTETTAKFNCSTTTGVVFWFVTRLNGSHEPIYKTGSVYQSFQKRFKVEEVDDDIFNLLITNIQIDDAGTYMCIDQGFGANATAQLIVIGKNF